MRQSHPLVIDGQLMGFAKGVVAEGRFVFLSGVTGRGSTMGDQAESCWATIKERLDALGGRLENIVQRMTFVTSVEEGLVQDRFRHTTSGAGIGQAVGYGLLGALG